VSNEAEKPIEVQWTKVEKVPFRRVLFSHISEYFAKPSLKEASNGSFVDGTSHEPSSGQPQHGRPSGGRVLIVNLAEAVKSGCAVCGGGLASSPAGERLLLANVTGADPYFFCASCGDIIISHVQSQEAAKHYAWDWAIPLRKQEMT
jgi:hypothetical protein